MITPPRRSLRFAPLVLVVALVAYVAIVVAMVTSPSVARAAAIGNTSDNTPWTVPSMPPKCTSSQIAAGDVASCVIADWGNTAAKGWGTPPFPFATVGGELSPGWKWIGWSYNSSPALAEWEANMYANPEKIGRLNAKQIKAPYAAHLLFMGFLTEVQDAGYRLNDAMAYNFRCTSNTRKDCAGLDSRSLSYHAYGLAVDINVVTNPEIRYYPDPTQGILTACAMPMKTNIPQWVVQTAQKWGLLWGGYGWNGGCASPMASKSSILRDPMHFEFRGTVEDAFAIARFNGVEFQDPALQVPTDGSSPATPVGMKVQRVHGSDRFASAAASAAFWPNTETVYLATGTNFPDSLAAGVTAARVDAPVLLVTTDSLPASTQEQLSRLKPRTVYVVGGPSVISDSVIAAAEKLTGGKVIRLFGPTRYETAELLTRVSWYRSKSSTAWVASGRDFQDPLIASAAAAVYDQPFLMIDGQRDVAGGTQELLRTLGVSRINVVAAPGAFSEATLAQLRTVAEVVVFGAADVAERSASVWSARVQSTGVVLATSLNFPDALAAVPFASRADATPLLLVPGTCVPSTTIRTIDRLDSTQMTLFGGPAALAIAVESLASC
ncbi:MAG: cell wall-binding repeat-containing protein [Ilumatobacteraceae bacterium]